MENAGSNLNSLASCTEMTYRAIRLDIVYSARSQQSSILVIPLKWNCHRENQTSTLLLRRRRGNCFIRWESWQRAFEEKEKRTRSRSCDEDSQKPLQSLKLDVSQGESCLHTMSELVTQRAHGAITHTSSSEPKSALLCTL